MKSNDGDHVPLHLLHHARRAGAESVSHTDSRVPRRFEIAMQNQKAMATIDDVSAAITLMPLLEIQKFRCGSSIFPECSRGYAVSLLELLPI